MTETDMPEIIGNLADVARFLKENGYCAPGKETPVKKSKVYDDPKKGILTFADPKAITLTEVQAYITKTNLLQLSKRRSDEMEDLRLIEMRENVRIARNKAERTAFENAVLFGKYLEKEKVELETSLKFSLLESLLKNSARADIPDWIEKVGGDQKKAQILCDKIYAMIDGKLDQISRMDEIKLILKRRN